MKVAYNGRKVLVIVLLSSRKVVVLGSLVVDPIDSEVVVMLSLKLYASRRAPNGVQPLDLPKMGQFGVLPRTIYR